MMNIIKKIVLVISMLFLFASLVLADIIYLKDGSVLRGKITEETTETITIEGEAYWTTIKRIDVQKIVREIEKLKEERVTVIREKPSEGVMLLAGVGLVFLLLLLIAAL